MEAPGLISEYVERLAGELDFDPSLSRCVRREVEDHLWEAVSANPVGDRLEAERRAVANFGDPRAIAAQFAVLSLAKHARRVGGAAVLMIAAVFVAMKARLTWYGVMECQAVDQMRALSDIVASIDRYAFWLSFLAGIACWLYIDRFRVPAAFTAEYRVRLRRFVFLCSGAAAALVASVVSDGVLTSLRLIGTSWSPEFLLPVFSMAIEIACAAVLVSYIRGMAQRAANTGHQSAIRGRSR
jgi:hypothetical protein